MMDVQVWTEFLKENWLVIVVALVILFLVLNFVRTVVKWALVLVIAAFIIIYSGISLKDIGNAVATVKEQAVNISQSEVLNMMKKEAKEAKLTQNSDGSFTISTPNLEVTGTEGSDKVKVSFHGVSMGEWSVNDTLKAFIQEAQRNSK
ncbi:Uncharacterised protein [Paenibacillus macerans]|uniref:Uncharacterized protein n=2 Tax=Paenibacillus macerans TaxID=44252 RepID=A0A090ZIT4_PAEMA|nr:hypothetical protein DJ90_917 [Paenibacillus macerans]GBK64665.1 hypothetical protein PbDSM24746_46690 [Paenibacillus macerans]GBK70901.1 hypothetical protein PbJCM17693_46090 [Paenibacillus macerans]GIP13234.1 hypothetical protein J1TS5_54040 [Paenibacillus macerans]SUD26332.1 Uncharacterised protein [Paenibacillus macerans]